MTIPASLLFNALAALLIVRDSVQLPLPLTIENLCHVLRSNGLEEWANEFALNASVEDESTGETE